MCKMFCSGDMIYSQKAAYARRDLKRFSNFMISLSKQWSHVEK